MRHRGHWLAVTALAAALPAAAHQGPLDSYGCHPNVAVGNYHCHAGPLAGRAYEDRERMQRAYEEEQQRKRPKPVLRAPGYRTPPRD
ncbi:MAG TPA: YHYH domain-containing protein [Burkholderiales bacterium]